MATYTVTKANFLDWYFNSGADQDQEHTVLQIGQQIIDELMESGKATITAEELFDQTNIECMPCDRLEEFDDDSDDYLEIGENQCIDLSVDEIKLID